MLKGFRKRLGSQAGRNRGWKKDDSLVPRALVRRFTMNSVHLIMYTSIYFVY